VGFSVTALEAENVLLKSLLDYDRYGNPELAGSEESWASAETLHGAPPAGEEKVQTRGKPRELYITNIIKGTDTGSVILQNLLRVIVAASILIGVVMSIGRGGGK